MTLNLEGVEWNPVGAVALAAACGILETHEKWLVELEQWKLLLNKGDEMLLAREAEMLSLVNTFEQRLVELEKRIDILFQMIKGTSSDLSDTEDLVEGHAVLIRQLAARVGLSLYEQQRILHESSNQPHHHTTHQQTETTTKEN